MNTKQIGDTSEAMVIARLTQNGYVVLKPLGDNQRYDLAIEFYGKFYRCQVKTAALKDNGTITFPTCSTYAHRGGKRKNYVGQADYIFVYCPGNDSVYWEKVDENTPQAERTLRLTPSNRGGILADTRTINKLNIGL